MKIAATALLTLAAVGTTSAFTTAPAMKSTFVLRAAEEEISSEPMAIAEEDENMAASAEPSVVATPAASEMSMALPFMARPSALTGEMPGDVGFDPLGFSKSKEDLMNYREAEVKHARLAMLAAAGWPLSELFDKKIAGALGMDAVLDAHDRVPSILNGGLGKISPAYWVGCVVAAAAIDFYGMSRKGNPEYFPGNLGFDPLGLYPKDKDGQERMQLAEIKNGRLAMIAVTAFAVQEFVSKLGVVDETPIFFKPLGTALHEYANTGYTLH